MTRRISIDCRGKACKEQMRHSRLDLRSWLDVYSHDPIIRRAEEELFTVRAPARLAAAILRDLDLLLSARKRNQEDLEHSSGLVGRVSEPFPVIRKLRFILVIRSLHNRKWFLVAKRRKNPDIFGAFRTLFVSDISAILRPVLDRFIRG